MNMMQLCAEAKRRQAAIRTQTGSFRHQGFYMGEILGVLLSTPSDDPKNINLIAQVIRDYKHVPDVLSEIADGMERIKTNGESK